jgi:hypothetical protein
LYGVHSRHQRGELIGYSSQVRLLSGEALPEKVQPCCILPQQSRVLLEHIAILVQNGRVLLLS